MGATKAETEFHRKMAARLFNETWKYLDKKTRNAGDDARMLNLAHASLYHWSQVGTPRNVVVGDWQVSRVYAALAQPGLALDFARRALVLCKKNGLVEIEHTVNEAMARGYVLNGELLKARRHLRIARAQLSRLMLDADDRQVYVDQIQDTESLLEGTSKRGAKRVASGRVQ